MRPQDAERIFGAADPAADLDLTARLDAVWDRLRALPEAPAPRTRTMLRLGLVAAVATVIAAAMALLPVTDRRGGAPGIPAPVQAFADELNGPGVLHVVTQRTIAVNPLGAVRPLPARRAEGWYALDGSAWRTRLTAAGDGYAEHVFDGRTVRAYSAECGLIETPVLAPPAPELAPLDLGRGLTAGEARVLGRTTVDGAPAYAIGYEPLAGDPYRSDWHVYVSADRARLLRVEAVVPPYSADPLPAVPIRQRPDVPTFEILPPSRRTAELLLPAPRFRGVTRSTCSQPPPARALPATSRIAVNRSRLLP